MKQEKEQLEKIKTEIFPTATEACRVVAAEMAAMIRKRQAKKKTVVFGLATGSTPVGLYRELIRLHREEGLSFANVITFNLDEYYPINPENSQSYLYFMKEQLFDSIDIMEENIHIPDGTLHRTEVFAACQAYEEKIRECGGIDLQILGIGRTGHIGFNEPGSSRESRTRMVTLDSLTRQDAAQDFLGEANVPRYAITMGVATILEARKVVLMAWGEGKAEIVQKAVEKPVSDHISASFLQEHPDARFFIDNAAAGELTQRKLPWRVTLCNWTPELSRRAVVWLSAQVGKPVLKLLDGEYNENGMGDLVTEQGPAYHLNIRIFNELQHTITGWPGGKPNADDTNRPERASPFPKTVIVFSPEPHEDVRLMGGTIRRLIDQGHKVHVAYMTSGSLAVSDEDARRFAGFLIDAHEVTDEWGEPQTSFAQKVLQALAQTRGDSNLSPEVRKIKATIRRGEARAACRLCGITPDNITFLDLPFYERGRLRNFNLTKEDVAQVTAFIDSRKPHQIYSTGALEDPSSANRLCFEAMERALGTLKGSDWLNACYVWLYRGGHQEWSIDEIDMTVPLSPDELAVKVRAIYKHQSQKSQVPGQDENLRESWQLAESRNRATAKHYDALGLAEYEALEAFKRWTEL